MIPAEPHSKGTLEDTVGYIHTAQKAKCWKSIHSEQSVTSHQVCRVFPPDIGHVSEEGKTGALCLLEISIEKQISSLSIF